MKTFIKKHRYLASAAVVVLVAIGAVLMAGGGDKDDKAVIKQADPLGRPNIMLIVDDDIGMRVGAYGDKLAKTPNIDRLAREGVLFTHMFSTSAVCAPSRSAIITGMHQQSIGTMHMRTKPNASGRIFGETSPYSYEAVPPAYVKAYPELLRRAGYYATNKKKMDYQFGEPFSIWDESSGKATWRKRPDGAPFFHMTTIMWTHESYGVTYWRWPRSLFDLLAQIRNASDLGPYPRDTRPSDVTVPQWLVDAPDTRRQLAQMYDAIHGTDIDIGVLLDKLQADGVLDNTIIIFTSDNGEGLPRGKRSLTDEGLHLPFIVRFPDKRFAGTTRDDMASFIDIAPTILAMAGVERPANMQGRDLFKDPAPDYVFAAADRFDAVTTRSKAVRDKRFTYIKNYKRDLPTLYPLAARDILPTMWDLYAARDAGKLTPVQAQYFKEPLPEEELYDSVTDPDDVKNLAADPAYHDTLVRLRDQLVAFNERVGDMSVIPEAEMINQMWPGGVQPETAAPDVALVDGKLVMSDKTEGASIGWRVKGDAKNHWRIYAGPVDAQGYDAVEAKAIRYGYKESAVTTWTPKG